MKFESPYHVPLGSYPKGRGKGFQISLIIIIMIVLSNGWLLDS